MLTLEEKACNHETWTHIHRVQHYLNGFIKELIDRGHIHDQSKLDHPEVEYFTEHTDALSKSTYNSEEYNRRTAAMKPALDHHYANNRHHTQFHKNGIDDMNLVDLLEMLCDWKAASERHNDGNINKSIEINGDKYKMSPQLIKIFENTAKLL